MSPSSRGRNPRVRDTLSLVSPGSSREFRGPGPESGGKPWVRLCRWSRMTPRARMLTISRQRSTGERTDTFPCDGIGRLLTATLSVAGITVGSLRLPVTYAVGVGCVRDQGCVFDAQRSFISCDSGDQNGLNPHGFTGILIEGSTPLWEPSDGCDRLCDFGSGGVERRNR